MTAEDFKSGQVLLIDKPLTWTSFQAVNKLRWEIRQAFNIKKIKVGATSLILFQFNILSHFWLQSCTRLKTLVPHFLAAELH